ncbi:hypothetical protein KY329_05270, partial [Candidatus Woesearchaeota archaeon]|nr:hypothetical protein [Candidatus Woesearchaeota archaeon]
MSMIKVKEYHDKLIEGVKKVLASDNFKELLRFSAKFHKYSFGNTLLIWIQRPLASHVAGIKVWNSLGRHVIKGEKGIAIFAPVTKKFKSEKQDVFLSVETPETSEHYEKERLLGFRAVYVWDIEQTEGKPVPSLKTEAPVATGDPEMLFTRILTASVVPVGFEDITGKAKGYYLPKEKRIVLSLKLSPEEKPKTLLHELAHHLSLTQANKEGKDKKDRPQEEVIAEGAAFMAAAYFGLDSSCYSFPYVASWGQDVEKILSAGTSMRTVAHQLI